jgi:zinc transport system substrate-binding protein
VLASFYPLQFVAQRVGGERVTVDSLTKPGVEPHDLELSPQDVAALADAASGGLVVYESGFQPAVDDAVTTVGASRGVLDVAGTANLDLAAPTEAGSGQASGVDPHFWLDPTKLADVADAVAGQLAQIDPAHASEYTANAADLRRDLAGLDRAFRTGLSRCTSRDLVTSHTAFGYLAERYGLTQQGIVGVNAEAEPTPTQLADIAEFVQLNDVRTIFTETLVSPAVADTVARETGAATAVLDPLEGLASDAGSQDYLTVMQQNLSSLRRGLGCR